MRSCPDCGEENSERSRFCQACGTALGDERIGDARKTVTVLFCDLVDSTQLGERLDPETLRLVLDRYFHEMRAAVERHGGTVEKFIGDAVLAVFGIPRVHEDDALRAVRAAGDMGGALSTVNAESGRGAADPSPREASRRSGPHEGAATPRERRPTGGAPRSGRADARASARARSTRRRPARGVGDPRRIRVRAPGGTHAGAPGDPPPRRTDAGHGARSPPRRVGLGRAGDAGGDALTG